MDEPFNVAAQRLAAAQAEVSALYRELAMTERRASRVRGAVTAIYAGVTQPEDVQIALGLLDQRVTAAREAAGEALRAIDVIRIQLTQGGQE